MCWHLYVYIVVSRSFGPSSGNPFQCRRRNATVQRLLSIICGVHLRRSCSKAKNILRLEGNTSLGTAGPKQRGKVALRTSLHRLRPTSIATNSNLYRYEDFSTLRCDFLPRTDFSDTTPLGNVLRPAASKSINFSDSQAVNLRYITPLKKSGQSCISPAKYQSNSPVVRPLTCDISPRWKNLGTLAPPWLNTNQILRFSGR